MADRENRQQLLDRGAEITRSLANLFAEKLKIPVYTVDSKLVEDVVASVAKDVPELTKLLSETDLRKEVSNFVSKLIVFPVKEEELGDHITKFIDELKQEKEYEAILLLDGLLDLPIGIEIGAMEICEKQEDRTELMEHVHYLEGKRLINSEVCSWAKVRFKSYRSVGLADVLFSILELPYSVLTLVMHTRLDVRDTVGAIYAPNGNISFLGHDEQYGRGWARYRADLAGEYMETLSSISQNPKPSSLEKKIIQALQVFWLSRLSLRTEIRFLLLISAFESLLLTPNDRDYLGHKLAEKTSFILLDDRDKRVHIFKLMKQYYSKRSDLVHRGKNSISEQDDRTADGIFRGLVYKLLDLTKTYDRMEQRSKKQDKKGVEDYIESLKFS